MFWCILPYLENLHSSEYGVPTFVKHNLFGRIKCIDRHNLRPFEMLFVTFSHTYQPTFCNNMKLKLKQKNTLLITHFQILFVWIFQYFSFDKIYLKYLIILLECYLYSLSLRHLVSAWWALGWTSHSCHHLMAANSSPTSTWWPLGHDLCVFSPCSYWILGQNYPSIFWIST